MHLMLMVNRRNIHERVEDLRRALIHPQMALFHGEVVSCAWRKHGYVHAQRDNTPLSTYCK